MRESNICHACTVSQIKNARTKLQRSNQYYKLVNNHHINPQQPPSSHLQTSQSPALPSPTRPSQNLLKLRIPNRTPLLPTNPTSLPIPSQSRQTRRWRQSIIECIPSLLKLALLTSLRLYLTQSSRFSLFGSSFLARAQPRYPFSSSTSIL